MNRGFTCILLARMMHLHHDGTSVCHCSTGKMHHTLYLWSKLNLYLEPICFIFSLLCIFQGRLNIPIQLQTTEFYCYGMFADKSSINIIIQYF